MSRRAVLALAALAALGGLANADPASAAFPGANGRIAFEGFGGGDSELYTIDPSGADRRRLTHDTMGDDHPQFSADGRRIVYETCRHGRCGIWTMRVDGTEIRRLRWIPSDVTEPTISRGRVAFLRRLHLGVYVTGLRRTDHRIRRIYDGLAAAPALSPDGRRIAFEAHFETSPGPFLYIADADGDDRERLTQRGGSINAVDREASFSPDGRSVVFYRRRGTGRGDCCDQELYSVATSGNALRRLTDAPGDAYAPCFSPDGRKVVFARRQERRWGIRVLDLASGRERQITSGNLRGEPHPDWQPLPR